jgi:DNA-directed RNA polymerase specialized sigma24 family protein
LILSRYQGLKYEEIAEIQEFKIIGIDKDYIEYCRELLKGKKELTPELVVKMKIDGI